MTAPLEIRKDIIGSKLYASRELSYLFNTTTENRSNVDFALTLRQVRGARQPLRSVDSAPVLKTAEVAEARKREPLAMQHPEGPYHGETKTLGRYQNYAATSHLIEGLTRVSSGSANGVDWMLNLRNGLHGSEHKPETSTWRRYFTRPQVSFDMTKENCSSGNSEFVKSKITPQDRRPDRNSGAISIGTIRDDPISFRRWPGCEGTNVGQWRHLIEDTSKGRKSKRHLQAETTMRQDPTLQNCAQITDVRSDGCLVEMLGKKKWNDSVHYDSLSHRPIDGGDPKLYHLAQLRPLAEQNEAIRKLRVKKIVRTDVNIPEARVPLMPRASERDSNEA